MQDFEGIEPRYHPLARPELTLQSTTPTSEQSDLREFLMLLKRYAGLIATLALATAVATYFFSSSQAKQYRSETTLLFSPTDSTQDPARSINTIVGISTTDAVLAPVASRYHLAPSAMLQTVSVTGDPAANLVKITAHSGSPTESALIANDTAQALVAYRAAGEKKLLNAQIVSLQRQLRVLAGGTSASVLAAASDLRAQLAQTVAQLSVASSDLSVLTPATAPRSAFAPHPTRNALIGLLAGLVLAVLIAALRERLDRRIRNIEEVEALYHAPLLGIVPFLKGARSRSTMLADFSSSGALADAYRTIRTNLALFSINGQGATVVVVTSATAEEGKSAITANVAQAMSIMGKRVLAVSADLHNPSLHEYFEAPSADWVVRPARAGRPAKRPAGLVQVLAGEVTLADAVRTIPLTAAARGGGGFLHLLADRSTFFDPAVLFSSRPMAAFLKQAKQQYDVIVFDTPPLLANADASLLAQEADILVLAARLEHLTKHQARRAFAAMGAARLTPTGVIVTGASIQPDYGYGYGYGFGTGDEGTVVMTSEQARTGASV